MNLFLQIVINGILLGGLYAIMAQGLALVWGVLNIVNLAHGTMIMLGGYVTWLVFANFGIDPFIGVFAAAAVMFCFGYALQRCVLNLVARGPMFNALLITFGIEIIFTDVAQHVFSADFRAIIPSYSAVNFNVYGITIPLMNLLAFIAAFVVSGFMFFFMMTTKLGRAIRATAQNLTAARLYGVEPRHLYAVTFGIGVAIAGVAGGLYATVNQLNPYIGVPLTAKSFAITIIGGLDNPLGVILGGLILGVIESLTVLYLGDTYRNVVSFSILVLVLIIRPGGLLGKTA
ncbi:MULTISPECIES: branched-chain amino acid ABC transporter permease [Brucella]|uniref:Branched-chain amino acid ABC transporter permease n=13 Tax=Brucella TaxID=234 RepID=A0AAI8EBZ2_BRUSS|nr:MULTISPECIES: branched-chain amino acid ABC transporter permease [Brucella]EXU84441.1 branched-chain amino acid ABC transporter permease [Brucella melitensis 548]QOK74313.1 branched-chain amino acid ABC transporter permease [Brucella suis bv. 2]AAL53343.1 high-affinity branched-chain amino acid transport system permease protein livh [Brucella melitensis bv. 1 str. 16M]AAN34352.1 branched-chain amino acid ABC transporter, permease protein [Brucella suis 1330]ABQ62714.1 branched-chain amino a